MHRLAEPGDDPVVNHAFAKVIQKKDKNLSRE